MGGMKYGRKQKEMHKEKDIFISKTIGFINISAIISRFTICIAWFNKEFQFF